MIHPKQTAVQRYLKQEPEPGAATGAATTGNGEGKKDDLLQRKSYCILRGLLPMPPSFRLVNRQGRVRSFDYSALAGLNMNTPEELLLHYEGRECYTLAVGGWNLDVELAEAFDDKRVLWVRELDELVAASVRKADPAEPVVTAIRIIARSTSREWLSGNTENRKGG